MQQVYFTPASQSHMVQRPKSHSIALTCTSNLSIKITTTYTLGQVSNNADQTQFV